MSASNALERAPTRIDLRKRVHRETADRLVSLAAHLPAPDRVLIEAVFRDQRSLADLIDLFDPQGVRSAEAARLERRQLGRRLRRLVERMSSPAYQAAAAGMGGWTTPQRRVAIACVLHGLTQREAASRLGLSLHTVRSHHRAVLAMCASAWKGARR